jgi:hypothetical protein
MPISEKHRASNTLIEVLKVLYGGPYNVSVVLFILSWFLIVEKSLFEVAKSGLAGNGFDLFSLVFYLHISRISSLEVPFIKSALPIFLGTFVFAGHLCCRFFGDYPRLAYFINYANVLSMPDTKRMLESIGFNMVFWSLALGSLSIFIYSIANGERSWNLFCLKRNRKAFDLVGVSIVSVTTIFLAPLREPLSIMSYSVLTHFRYESIFKNVVVGDSVQCIKNPEGEKPSPDTPLFGGNILIIVFESFSAEWLNRTENGREITPHLNRLSRKRGFFNHFYANGTYTINGHSAIVSSQYPPRFGSIAENYPDRQIEGLGGVLKKSGYKTHYWSAGELMFNNTSNFMVKCGFEDVRHIVGDGFDQRDKWSWGLNDKKFLEICASRWKTEIDAGGRHLHVISTVANHFPFNSVPLSNRFIFQSPSNLYQRFANSVNFSDFALGQFVEWFSRMNLAERCLLVVTADHSMPLGDGRDAGMNSLYYEENISIPCLFLGPRRVMDQLNFNVTSSQVDIAPTIAGLLGFSSTPCEWVGNDLTKHFEYSAINVQQSGDGYISIIQWPEKQVLNLSSRRLISTNLETDSEERHYRDSLYGKQYKKMLSVLERVHYK